jgi:peroxiredoxin Q/BCP
MSNEVARLEPGDKAPELSLLNQDNKSVTSQELLATPTIFFFFPAAGSPGCTKEAVDFQEYLEDFAAQGYQVVGISPDSPSRLKEFALSHDLSFQLLSDPDLEAHRSFGAFGQKTLYGRVYTGVLRSTIVTNEKGKIDQALYNVKATGHTNMLKKRLGI